MNKPFIPVHHIRGHIAATYLAYPELKPPFLTLIASGGHSEIVMDEKLHRVEILGGHTRTTQQARRSIKLPACSVSAIRAARRSTSWRRTAMRKCTSCRIRTSRMRRWISPSRDSKQRSSIWRTTPSRRGETIDRNGLAASFCAAVVHTLVPRLEMAVKQTHARRVVCAGGVAANSFLRAALQDMAKREHVQLFMPPLQLCGDNAAMIGSQAYYEYQAGTRGKTLQNAYATADIGKNICD